MVKANVPAGLGQRDTMSPSELFLCVLRPNLHGKLPGTSDQENSRGRLFQHGRPSPFHVSSGSNLLNGYQTFTIVTVAGLALSS